VIEKLNVILGKKTKYKFYTRKVSLIFLRLQCRQKECKINEKKKVKKCEKRENV